MVGRYLRKKRKTKFRCFLYEGIKNSIFFGGTLRNYSIVCLKQNFFDKHQTQHEILGKPNRPHLVLLLYIDNLTFAIPFRTNAHKPRNAGISHCYFFKTSSRKEKSAKGRIPALDFSKSLVIEDEDIDFQTKIDNNEFKELQDNRQLIEEKFKKYLHYFITSIQTKQNLERPAIKYSTLHYFTAELSRIKL